MADIVDRIPPQAIEAETAVLGSMLIEKEAVLKVLDILRDTDFYKGAHRNIFRIIRDLYMENQPVDTITVSAKLKTEKLLEDIGGGAYLTQLVNSVSTAANVEHYAEIVHEKAILRTLITVGSDIVGEAFNEKSSPTDILFKAGEILYKVSEDAQEKGFVPLSELVHPALERIEKLHADKKDVPGLRTGFDDFDRMTAGLQPSELIIIAGRPSMGKTAFGLNIIENVALLEKLPVALFSLEMSKEQLMMRLLCSAAQVDAQKTRQGFIAGQNWSKLTTVAGKLAEAPIYIDDSATLNVMEIRTRSRRLANELRMQNKQLSLIVIDYIQMMRGVGRSESRQLEMAEISRSLKALARDLKIPVIALSQLSRKPEEKGREGKPQLSDLRESGALEQDADVVGFIYRESYYRRDDPDLERKATLILAKQRNGPTGDIDLAFFREFTRFENTSKVEV